jgi:hypothetical protein
MSIKIMSEVWESSKHSGSFLLCLLAIADRANDDGVAWPGIDELKHKARVKDRQIYSVLDKLFASSELIAYNRANEAGGFTSNCYVVVSGCNDKEIKHRVSVAQESVKGIIQWNAPATECSTPPCAPPQYPPALHRSTPLHSTAEESSVDPSIESPTDSAPKIPRPRDLLFDVIASWVFGIKPEMVSKVKNAGARIGKAKAAVVEAHRAIHGEDSFPTPEDVSTFLERYAEDSGDLTPPRDSSKLAENWLRLMGGDDDSDSAPSFTKGQRTV